MLPILTSLAAQDSLARQQASVARQKRAAQAPASSLERQHSAAARQRAAAARARPDESSNVTPATFEAWSNGFLPPACPSLEWQEARDRFDEEERRNDLPEGLLSAVALQESGLHPCAVSSAGAAGLMQLMPDTAAELGVGDPLDPWQSLQGGGQFLRSLLNRYGGDLRLALGAYNAGPSRVDFFGGVPPFTETQNYVDSVMARMRRATVAESPVKP